MWLLVSYFGYVYNSKFSIAFLSDAVLATHTVHCIEQFSDDLPPSYLFANDEEFYTGHKRRHIKL